MIVVPLLLALAAPPARIEPTVGATGKLLYRQLVLDLGDPMRERDLMFKPLGFTAGVQVYYLREGSFDTGGWRGNFEVGVESMLPQGTWPLSLQHTSAYEWRLSRTISMSLGASVVAALDLPSIDYSHFEVGAPLGLVLRRVDVIWTPSVSLPAQVRRDPVFTGELRRSIAPMFMPLNLMVRVKLPTR